MFFKPATIATAALATLAAATPTRLARTGPPSSNCGSTTIECCTHVGTATELKSVLTPLFVGEGLISGLLVKLGLVDVLAITAGIVGSVNAVLGLTCSSIAIGGSCTAQQVCCENVVFNGLINVGCVAIDIL